MPWSITGKLLQTEHITLHRHIIFSPGTQGGEHLQVPQGQYNPEENQTSGDAHEKKAWQSNGEEPGRMLQMMMMMMSSSVTIMMA